MPSPASLLTEEELSSVTAELVARLEARWANSYISTSIAKNARNKRITCFKRGHFDNCRDEGVRAEDLLNLHLHDPYILSKTSSHYVPPFHFTPNPTLLSPRPPASVTPAPVTPTPTPTPPHQV